MDNKIPRKLTAIHIETAQFVSDFIEINGFPPSVKQFAYHFEMSVQCARKRLDNIVKLGIATRYEGKALTLRIAKDLRLLGAKSDLTK